MVQANIGKDLSGRIRAWGKYGVYWTIPIWKEVTLTKFECGGRFDLRPDVK